jgi:hypothetical protein
MGAVNPPDRRIPRIPAAGNPTREHHFGAGLAGDLYLAFHIGHAMLATATADAESISTGPATVGCGRGPPARSAPAGRPAPHSHRLVCYP